MTSNGPLPPRKPAYERNEAADLYVQDRVLAAWRLRLWLEGRQPPEGTQRPLQQCRMQGTEDTELRTGHEVHATADRGRGC